MNTVSMGENAGAAHNTAPQGQQVLGERQANPTKYVAKMVPDVVEVRHHQAEVDGITVLTTALKRSNQNLEKCHAALRAVKAEKTALEDQVRQHQTEHRQALADLEEQLVGHQRVHAELVEERDALRERLASAQTVSAEEQEHHARSALQLRSVQQSGAALRGQLSELQAEWRQVREAALAMPAQFGAAAEDVARAVEAARRQGMAEKEERIQEMVARLREAEDKVEWAMAERAEYKRRCDEAELVRRKLHNQVQNLRGNLRVVCRVRPLNERERAANTAPATVVEERAGSVSVMSRHTGRQNNFDLSAVLGPSADQGRVFEQVDDLVVSTLDGYNVCIFAYGQTGSGKTHTMEGPRDNRGVSHRSLQRLFEMMDEREGDATHRVAISMIEVYNEQIFDLLGRGGGGRPASPDLASPCKQSFDIRTGERGVVVKGLGEVVVRSKDEVAAVIAQGQAARAMAATGVHDRSSRSHCVIRVGVESTSRVTGTTYYGKLNLVDLAGSENVGRSGVTGAALREAQAINRSLSALGDVFQALAQRRKHVPYRNSKLTHLLSDSLGGDSKTLMVVCLNPGEDCVSETLNSLNFAATASSIQLGGATPCKKKRERL